MGSEPWASRQAPEWELPCLKLSTGFLHSLRQNQKRCHCPAFPPSVGAWGFLYSASAEFPGREDAVELR